MFVSIKGFFVSESPMRPTIAKRIIDVFNDVSWQVVKQQLPLTNIEMELLTFIAKSELNKEICERLNITIATIKKHFYKFWY